MIEEKEKTFTEGVEDSQEETKTSFNPLKGMLC